MPKPTPAELLENLRGPGLLLVKESNRYFIPMSVVSDYILPDEFGPDAVGASAVYFDVVGTTAEVDKIKTLTGSVAKGLEDILREFWATDGVRQAVWLEGATPLGTNHVNKAVGSKKALFSFKKNEPGSKVLVDASKGGRPSNR
jgi:hypothetical protein